MSCLPDKIMAARLRNGNRLVAALRDEIRRLNAAIQSGRLVVISIKGARFQVDAVTDKMVYEIHLLGTRRAPCTVGAEFAYNDKRWERVLRQAGVKRNECFTFGK